MGYFGFQEESNKSSSAKDKAEARKRLIDIEPFGVFNAKEQAIIEKALDMDDVHVKSDVQHYKDGRKGIVYTITLAKVWGE